ncbi:ABC transporter substrate-binding protein [Streptosporangiaceae bacterium NEAU-GS5]|nr:ABC transporter substrate-binding protein [Streptosporangiaceae bacterium NEAU-GS5]
MKRLTIGVALVATLGACGTTTVAPPVGKPEASAWSFTDDRGTTITLPRRPARIVAQSSVAAALWDLGVRPVGVFGPHKRADGTADPEVVPVDITKVEGIGNVWDEFNVEKYAALRPDLLVSSMYVKDTLWYVPDRSKAQIEKIAPTVGISLMGRSADQLIERYASLAKALGANVDAPQIVKDKARFEAAAGKLKTFAAEHPDLKVMFASGAADLFYVCYPPDYADLSYYIKQGLDVVTPKADKGGYFESLSWENADKYAADVIFVDSRTQALTIPQMAAKPTWAALPAVKAGHVYPWNPVTRLSYTGYADMLESILTTLTTL